MGRQCSACRSEHPHHANFCAICGRALPAPPALSPVRTGRLAMAVVVAVAASAVIVTAARSPRVTVSRSLDLPSEKSAALYELLRPSDVKVIVSRDHDRLRVRGTPAECDAVSAFAGLVTRHVDHSPGELKRCMAQARRGWSTKKTYKLSTRGARALFGALAPEDVPVLVSRTGNRVRVEASVEDQAIVAEMASILRGHRL